ncbi:prolipoprotein diacylglyceryl transferase [Williamsoniiplasma somnilux]|uniref:Prolipoprotein diacylglyceryl transferase n=1 Tax=Williamsoniiplasma somnilux TaxID=215578 RepID=A0A2K8NYX5_9MOLU|nr:prolipoprotein diacylglyceryl transferase family protein [Williamsoniiplasma somnilux]ATZ19030.1 prolipoprotein diacylglyceryl transferase [Williamsoniiplasma somnilux]
MLLSTIGEWIVANGDPAADRSFGGVVPAYPVFMFVGIIIVIFFSIIKMKIKKIPLREFELAIITVVPIGVIGGSIFGKIFIPGIEWYTVFFFWQPGMSLFGALILGTVAGFVIFYVRSKKTLISVWVYADCIIPNILIGQAIGRWGNMFNHEILGSVVSYDSLWWLVDSIKNKLFYFPNLAGFELETKGEWWTNISEWSNWKATSGPFQGLSLENVLNWKMGSEWLVNDLGDKLDPNIYNYGTIQFRNPLFLYESLMNIGLWLIITFVINNLGRWFSPTKPWDLEPKAYPGWYNKKYKSLKEQEIVGINTQLPIKYKKVQIKTKAGENIELKLGFYQAWNKAFYWYQPDEQKIHEFEMALNEKEIMQTQQLSRLTKIKKEHKQKIVKSKADFRNKLSRAKNSNDKQQLLKSKKQNFDLIYQNHQEKLNEIYALIGNWTRIFKGNPEFSKGLEKLNNPNKYFVIRCGVTTGFYVFGYMLIRVILETQRRPEELFIQNSFVADFIVLTILLLLGIVIIIFAQFIAPYKYREVNWLYEKSY